MLFATVVSLGGCGGDPDSPRGFRLPDGDADTGRQAFVRLECHACHTIAGERFPEIEDAEPTPVELGRPVTRVKTYAELVTSIINPSHELSRGYARRDVAMDGESRMRNYNDVMTVTELTDIVTFLQPHYDVVVPQEFQYPMSP